jgi:hypothetical protein
MTRDEQALLVGLGAVGVVGLAAYLLGRDEIAVGAGVFIAPPEMRVPQLQREVDKITAKLLEKGATQNSDMSWDFSEMSDADEGRRYLKALEAVVASLRFEKSKIPSSGISEEAVQARVKRFDEEKRLQGHKKFWERMSEQLGAKTQAQTGFRKGAWTKLTQPPVLGIPQTLEELAQRRFKDKSRRWYHTRAGQEIPPHVDTPLEQILRKAHEDEALARARRGAYEQTEEYQKELAERRAELRRQEEELRPERILPPDFDTFAARTPQEDPNSLNLQWQALRKLRDSDFEFPDEPVWDQALEALRNKGLMIERQDPKKPEYVIYGLSREAKRIFSKPVRSRCTMHVPIGALPIDVRKSYRDRGLLHTICGTRSFFTEDGKRALSVQTLQAGSSGGEPLLVTERWSKQADDSWRLFDDRAQHVSLADLRAAVESSSTSAEAMRYMIKPPPTTEAQQVAKAEEEIRRHEANLQREIDEYLATRGADVLAPKKATADEVRLRERLRVHRGGGSLKHVLDERVNEDFFVPGGGRVRVRFYEDERSIVHQILHKYPPHKAMMEDVAKQLHIIGAEFARTPGGKPGYEGVYKTAGTKIVKK